VLAQKVKAKDAVKYIGQECYVEGQVYGMRKVSDSKSTLVFVGDYFPKHYFTAIVEDDTKGFVHMLNTKYLWGEYIRVYGLIITYKGKTAVRVQDWSTVVSLDFKDEIPSDFSSKIYQVLKKQHH
jgi:hypothetical protein